MCRELPELDYLDGLRYILRRQRAKVRLVWTLATARELHTPVSMEANTRGTKRGSPAIRELLDYLQFNPDILKRWIKLTARCGSMEALEEQM